MVSSDGITSNSRNVAGGIIQGGVIGLLFFLMPIIDALSSISHGVSFLFADDVKAVCPPKSNEVCTTVREIYAHSSALEVWRTSRIKLRYRQ